MKNNSKTTILLSISALVLFLFLVPPQSSFAATLTLSDLDAGNHIIDFRDITDTSDSAPALFAECTNCFPLQDGTLTAIDRNANVDLNSAETVSVNIGSTIGLLTETGINTGVFSGFFNATSDSITYDASNPDAARARIDINLATPGDVTISDVILPDTGIGCSDGNEPVTHGVNIALSNGATLASINSITISYANAVLFENPPENLKIYYQSDPNFAYTKVTELFIPGANEAALDTISLTIKTDSPISTFAGFGGTLGEGTYVPTLELGCGGGGGGGIARAGLVVQALGALKGAGGSSLSDPPTLGLGQNQKRIVDGGFSFNGNPVNVEQYYTHYPLITTPVGQNNTIKLKIYEEKGLDNIAHVGLSYGLGKGEIFNEGRATIEYDRTFDGVESVTKFDPEHVLGEVNVTTTDVRCSDNSNVVCREFSFHHVFREPLEYNMVATNIWDLDLNGWQNYFNHGIHIVGDSMNPPDEYSGINKGHIYHLTETGKNTAIDDDGNNWTFDRIWNRDYIKSVHTDSDILNQKKIDAIEQLGFQYSDGQEIFGYARVDHRFADTVSQEQIEAQTILNNMCPECKKEPFEKINNIFSYDLPDRHSKLDDLETVMKLEDQKARQYLQTFFEQIYHKSVD
jgi:hypothetical protein